MVNNLRVVIAAAGSGSRMGSKTNKQYIQLGTRPLLTYSLDTFEKMEIVKDIIIVAKEPEIEYCEKAVVKACGYKKVSRVIAGGLERQDSIWLGLNELDKDTDYVAVHDGARPFVTVELVMRILEAAVRWGAAIPAVAVRDTLKKVDKDNFVRQTLDRAAIFAIQTPQIFRYGELYKSYEYAREQGINATDDASLYEKYIGRVKVVPGDYNNLKITTPEDLVIARTILETTGKE